MNQKILYNECPLCNQAPVVLQNESLYQCQQCGLTLKDRSILSLFKKGRFGVTNLGQGDFSLAKTGLKNIELTLDPLKTIIGNIYTDQQLADIAVGAIDAIRPIKTILAQIILEQLNEACYINVQGLRRGHGSPLAEKSWYQPPQKISRSGMEWQDKGNLFCTDQRLVFPSNRFTFIRLDRKVVAAQAFTDGIAIQRKGQDFATYFAGCYPHEASLVTAYVMAKVPILRPPKPAKE